MLNGKVNIWNVGNMLLLVRSLYQKIIAWGGLCGNGSFLGLFLIMLMECHI